ncbi:hypothetical protein D3C73_1280280 [compost metagenome]
MRLLDRPIFRLHNLEAERSDRLILEWLAPSSADQFEVLYESWPYEFPGCCRR